MSGPISLALQLTKFELAEAQHALRYAKACFSPAHPTVIAAHEARFVKIGRDGQPLPMSAPEWVAVCDHKTGLMWSAVETERMTQPQAVQHAAGCEVAAFTDWRLPPREELLTLVDDTRYAPAIDTHFFPACNSRWYWTSTPAAYSPADCAWGVSFNYGGADWSGRDGDGFVRAVRASQ